MSKLIVINHLTLDGVMQGPGRPDEDRRGGFAYGGWAEAGDDPVLHEVIGARTADAGCILLGRRTYEGFAGFWPKQTGDPFSTALDNAQKYVASRTLRAPLAWQNSTLLEGDAAEAVARLKHEQRKDIMVFGSGELVASLASQQLVDEYVLMIHPLVLGTGRRMFGDVDHMSFRLVESKPTGTGVVVAVYESLRKEAR